MKRAAGQDDSTIKLKRPLASVSARRRSSLVLWGWVAAGAVAGAGAAGWMVWPRAPVAAIASIPVVVDLPTAPRPKEFSIETASEAQIRGNVSTGLTIFRLAENTNVMVLDFSELREQGLMFNRLGAFAEKAGIPHDRVLTDGELEQAIRRGGDTPETYYYGHDYSASTVARFFAAADRDRIVLNQQEESLRRLMLQEGWFAEGKEAGLISVPRAGADARVTPDARATILHHELSHGEYFSNRAYAAYAHQFWVSVLTPKERDAMRRYLVAEDYDPNLEELIENEAQAYLIFTYNPLFFAPSMVGMTEARRVELRTIFLRAVPAPWIRESLPPQPAIARAAAH